MICLNCDTESSHVKILPNGRMVCHSCAGYAESGGIRTDKILTRNAARVRDQSLQYEGDLITPYVVDKNTNQAIVNEEFINLYPEQAAGTYTQEELRSVGQPDLRPTEAVDDKQGIEFNGDESEVIRDIVEA